MKLVQLLAKELKEWPENSTWCSQDSDKEIRFEMVDGDFFASELADGHGGVGDGERVTKSQWQAEREKMNKPKWIRHRGGLNPINDDVLVEVKLRSGDIQSAYSSDFIWRHVDCDYSVNIMQYRIIEETEYQEIEEVKVADVKLEMLQGDSWVTIGSVSSDFGASVFDGGQPAKGEEVKKTNFGTITYKLEIDATEATQQIDSLVAKWGQIESPLKWRDAIIHCQAIIEDCEREIERNVNLLDAEGLMMQKDSKKAMQRYAPYVDFSDWRNWQIGDRVCATKNFDDVDIGDELIITRLDHADEEQPIGMSAGSSSTSWPKMSWVKFIRRP